MKESFVFTVSALLISACSPHTITDYSRANTSLNQTNQDKRECDNMARTSRLSSPMGDVYRKCMTDRGYSAPTA
jgi:hypothetical protein